MESALDRGARVIAVEAWSKAADGLRRTYARETAEGRVIVHQVLLADTSGAGSLVVDPDWPQGASVSLPEDAKYLTEPVARLTLDDLIAGSTWQRCDFVKMDIEGSEQSALAGARRVIAAHRPGCPSVPTTGREITGRWQPRFVPCVRATTLPAKGFSIRGSPLTTNGALWSFTLGRQVEDGFHVGQRGSRVQDRFRPGRFARVRGPGKLCRIDHRGGSFPAPVDVLVDEPVDSDAAERVFGISMDGARFVCDARCAPVVRPGGRLSQPLRHWEARRLFGAVTRPTIC